MVANISYNPQVTTAASGMFSASSTGLTQGTAYPDPAIRFKLVSGVLLPSETLPMWGGVGIFTDVPSAAGPSNSAPALGTPVGRATSLTGSTALTGFSVFDQAYGMINSPQSPVPLAASSMQVMYYRLGSGARIAVAADPALVSLRGGITNPQVSWDFNEQRLVPYAAAYNGQSISSMVYTSSTGLLALTFASAPFGTGSGAGVGLDITLTGISVAALNGDWTITASASSGTVITVQAPTGLGALSPTGGSLVAGGGALPVQVLDIQTTNCQVVSYDPTTGFATWNFNGSAAVILI